MRPAVRILFVSLISFVLLISIAVGIGIYKPKIYSGLYNWILFKNTGYQFTIEDISIQLSPSKVFVKGLVLNNPEWNENSQLLRIDNAELSIQVGKLFRNEPPYWSGVLNDSEVIIIKDEQGNSNWNTSVLTNKDSEVDEPIELKNLLSFSEVSISDSSIKHIKGESTEEIEISSISIKHADQSTVQIQGTGLYKMEQVNIDGEISIEPSGEALLFTLNGSGLDIKLQTSGTINPNNINDESVHVNASSENLDQLEDFLKEKFPDVEPISLSLQIDTSNAGYEASKLKLNFGENTIIGNVFYDSTNNIYRLKLESETLDLSQYFISENESLDNEAQKTDSKIAEVNNTPIEKKTDEVELDWTWKNFGFDAKLEVGKIVANHHEIKNFSASLNRTDKDINIEYIKGQYEQIDKDSSQQIFTTDLLEISGTVEPLGLALTTQDQDILLSLLISEGDSKIVIDGPVNLNGSDGTKLKIDAKATELDSLSQYLQQDFSPYLPANISVDIETVDQGLKIENLIAQSKDSDLSGEANIDWSSDIVKVDGAFNSKVIDIEPTIEDQGSDGNASTHKQENKQKAGKVFSDAEIDWSWLEKFDANIDINIDEFKAPSKVFVRGEADNTYSNVHIKLYLADGVLNINPIQANLAEGKINSVLNVSKVEEGAHLDFKVDALNITLDSLGASGDAVVDGGVTDVLIDFDGKGKSAHQIASSLNGEIVIDLQEAIVENTFFELIGTDLFFKLVSTISPFVKETKTTELECLAIKFKAEDGVLTSDKQMAIESTRMKVVGSGKIDLHTENIAIGFTPIAKKGVGVNVSNIVKFVYLGGTLSNPKMENDPLGIAKSGVAVTTAVATGGLSLIAEGLFKRVTNAGDICARALEDAGEDQEEELPKNMMPVSDQPEDQATTQ